MMRFQALFAVAFVCLLGLGTYGVSLVVGARYDEMVALEKQIAAHQVAIRSLRTERGYLGSPEKLEVMAAQLLPLAMPKPVQLLTSIEALRPELVPQAQPALDVQAPVDAAPQTRPVAVPVARPAAPARVLMASAPASGTRAVSPPARVRAPEIRPAPARLQLASASDAPTAAPASFLSAEALATIQAAAAREEQRR